MTTKKCCVCSKEFDLNDLFPVSLIRPVLQKLLQQDLDKKNLSKSYICTQDLTRYRLNHTQKLLEEDIGDITNLEEQVLISIKNNEVISANANEDYEESLNLGERIADKISNFGGSWTFIIFFLSFIVGWMILNTYFYLNQSFDPYPYILLNLILSCLAAIQAPIIMMSQNRRSEKDRIKSDLDYQVNLKSELELRHLHIKMNTLMKNQWQRLMEIQQLQMELMETLINGKK